MMGIRAMEFDGEGRLMRISGVARARDFHRSTAITARSLRLGLDWI